MAATNDLEALLQSSDLDIKWLDYSVSSDTEEDYDATSSIDISIEDIVEEVSILKKLQALRSHKDVNLAIYRLL
jgi:hypothetical protein